MDATEHTRRWIWRDKGNGRTGVFETEPSTVMIESARYEVEEVVPLAALNEFRDGLTEALNAHGVPAMPSWREAIDWLAANGGR